MNSENIDFSGMTVNERLFTAKIADKFDIAIANKDFDTAVKLLMSVDLTRENAESSVDSLLRYPERFKNDDFNPFIPMGNECIQFFIKQINRIGIPIRFPAELNLYKDIDGTKLQNAILQSLLNCSDERQQWILIGHLNYVEVPIDGSLLIKVYEKAKPNGRLRFSITEIMHNKMVTNLEIWLIEILSRDSISSNDIGLLPIVLARISKIGSTRTILQNLFSKSPIRVSKALEICGEEEDIEFLQNKVDEFESWERKQIENAISSIKNRLRAY